ncbi:hypothetical protein C2I36_00420 [Rhodobacteraceae bacterium WD3A24]|nr:hypothetical protein C2I36_00420 [Rhodobacteraceae bacterium WD3A24]
MATVDIKRIEAALEKVAQLVVADAVYLPVFERLEEELKIARARDDVFSRAKAIAMRQKARV